MKAIIGRNKLVQEEDIFELAAAETNKVEGKYVNYYCLLTNK